VVTAHRNKTERFKDLQQVLAAVHRVREEAVLVATVLVGTAERVLNVPDRAKPFFLGTAADFDTKVVPRLSSGDASLWSEFPTAISKNRPNDPRLTVERFRSLPVRQLGTHMCLATISFYWCPRSSTMLTLRISPERTIWESTLIATTETCSLTSARHTGPDGIFNTST